MEYEPCYICGQETEENNCKNCTDEITKLHTEFHTFQVDFDEVVIRLYRAQRKIEALELELETLGANCIKAMELKDDEIEKLKAEDELTKWKLKVQVVAREDERFGPWNYVNVKVDDIGYADKVAVLSPGESLVKISELHEAQAEVERLKTSLAIATHNNGSLTDEFNRAIALIREHCPKLEGSYSWLIEGIVLLVEERDAALAEVEGYGEVISDLAGQIKSHEDHTWQQERAAVVRWLRAIVDSYGTIEHGEEWPEDLTRSLCDDIERSEHWQMKENQND